jgi:hypothetical protein
MFCIGLGLMFCIDLSSSTARTHCGRLFSRGDRVQVLRWVKVDCVRRSILEEWTAVINQAAGYDQPPSAIYLPTPSGSVKHRKNRCEPPGMEGEKLSKSSVKTINFRLVDRSYTDRLLAQLLLGRFYGRWPCCVDVAVSKTKMAKMWRGYTNRLTLLSGIMMVGLAPLACFVQCKLSVAHELSLKARLHV